MCGKKLCSSISVPSLGNISTTPETDNLLCILPLSMCVCLCVKPENIEMLRQSVKVDNLCFTHALPHFD